MLSRSFLVMMLLRFCLTLSAQEYSDDKVTLMAGNASLASIMKNIEKQTHRRFNYSETEVNTNEKVNVSYNEAPLNTVLGQLFSAKGITWKYIDNGIYLRKEMDPTIPKPLKDSGALTSGVMITGQVTDDKSLPLIGATIKVANSKMGAVTDVNGRFHISDVPPNAVMIVSFTGFVAERFTLKNKSAISIVLRPAVSKLDETVVIGYGTTTQRYNTGSVSRVSAKEIQQQPVSNVLLALQGRVPGLTITPVNGLPGAAVKVQLRGKNSIFSGSDPLFIIDGVPMASGNNGISSGSMASTFTGYGSAAVDAVSPFSTINPDDIESIDVLKDADATSIYGSRGANGVILITTKKGKAGKTGFNVSASSGISQSTKIPKMLNTKEYLQVRRKAFQNDGVTPTKTNAYDLLVWDTTRNTDWQKMLQGNTAHTTNANASVSGGNKNTQFLIGTGYHHDGTVLLGNGYNNRVSLNSNLNHQSADQKFGLDFSTIYSSNNINMPQSQSLSQLPPNAPPLYNEAGQINWGPPGGPFNNPMALVNNKYEIKSDNLLSSLQLTYRITTDLKIKTRVGYNSISSNEISTFPQIAVNPNTTGTITGSSNFANTSFKSWSVEPQLEYSKKVLGGQLNALLGGSWQKIQNSSFSISASGYTNDALIKSIAAAPVTNTDNRYSEYKYAAMFGRINYNLNDKYLINISGRRDGSSRFGPGHRYSNFGALGVGWIISNENFVKDHIPVLSYAKIRGSYGTSGNDQIGDYKYLDAWSSIYQLPYQGITTLTPEGLFNPNYNWERNRKLEGALELGLWNNRLLTTLAYFRNRCDNQLILYNLPSQTGFSNVTANLPALIQNSGFEISLSGDILSTKNFKWNINANITIPKNKLLSFPDLLTSPYATVYKTGQSINVINGYHSLGINDKGIYTFTDVNGDNMLDGNDFLPIANLDPKYYGGIGNHLSYKGIDLDIFFEFKNQDGQNYFGSIYANRRGSPGFINNQPAEMLYSKEIQNFTASTRSAAYRQLGYLSSSDVIYSNASYIRLKNLSLSYNLSSILKSQLKMRVFLLGQNLFTITKYKVTDPETQNLQTLPPLRTITAGLQVTL
ncbi:SusC/RagA family TonB-linked outer membrane protein [Chitinophaga sp. RAB17]|uniref:SusC/RagA family TonB-linked outer membrane protein n=1 Tax=Chitinophaga sp. RAB17 TaxID=3233049 RepID=UPI003F90E6B7